MNLERETAERQLDEISHMLRSWANPENANSDSVRIQNLRAMDMSRSSAMLESLVYEVQPDHRLVLKISDKPVTITSFRKGVYDMYSHSHYDLDPNQSLRLDDAEKWSVGGERELYVGDVLFKVAVSGLAKALVERSQLVVMTSEEAKDLRPTYTS